MKKSAFEKWNLLDKGPDDPYLYHEVFEGENPDFAFHFSRINEVGILKFVSSLQIYKRNTTPIKIYDSGSIAFLYDISGESSDQSSFIVDWSLADLACFRQFIVRGGNKYEYPFIIISLPDLKYALISDASIRSLKLLNSKLILAELFTDDKNVEANTINEREFVIDDLYWLPLNELSK
jgi:hypothetical protein